MKEKFNNLEQKFKSFMNTHFNKITTQLILGISLIVFVSTLTIGLIFLSQYRQLSLKREEQELTEKSYQLADLGNVMLSSDVLMPRDRLFGNLKGITDSDFWIISGNGNVVVSTTGLNLSPEVQSLNNKFMNKIKSNKSIVTYDYSSYFGTKTLTVITPIVQGNYLMGAIILHKDVNIIYSANTYFTALIFISILISLALSIILGIFYSRYFTEPIKKITEVTKKIAERDYGIRTNINDNNEIGELAVAIDQMTEDINKNIEEIKELEKRAKELVANVSHEFKTPLTLIRGYVENLQDKTTKPSKEVYENIITNTEVLEKLVNELLDLSKFQAGTVVLKKEPLLLKQLVKDVMFDMRNLSKKKDIKIKLIEEYKEKQILEADYIKMRQLLTIFLDNSIKYSNEGGNISIIISKGCLSITDNGIGIEQSKLEQLFERYYQVDNNKNGYGLGLCIAKYIADAHNYKLSIESVENKGTTVKVIF